MRRHWVPSASFSGSAANRVAPVGVALAATAQVDDEYGNQIRHYTLSYVSDTIRCEHVFSSKICFFAQQFQCIGTK